MPVLRLLIEYVGTAYHGWQIQPGVPTVQGEIEKVLAVLLREPVRAAGAARTDAGVHALGQVATVRVAGPADPRRLLRSLNALLPDDIAVRGVREAPDDFHARHSASGRVYRYQIVQGETVSPFQRPFAAHSRRHLDVPAMDEAARALIGVKDFSSFRAAGDVSETPVKEIRSSSVELTGAWQETIVYTVEASSFLQYMVRNIAGTLIEVGRGRLPAGEMAAIVASRDRRRAGPTAPARGLCLMKVLYPGLAPPQDGW